MNGRVIIYRVKGSQISFCRFDGPTKVTITPSKVYGCWHPLPKKNPSDRMAKSIFMWIMPDWMGDHEFHSYDSPLGQYFTREKWHIK